MDLLENISLLLTDRESKSSNEKSLLLLGLLPTRSLGEHTTFGKLAERKRFELPV